MGAKSIGAHRKEVEFALEHEVEPGTGAANTPDPVAGPKYGSCKLLFMRSAIRPIARLGPASPLNLLGIFA